MFLSDQEIINNLSIKGQEDFAFSHLVNKYKEKVYWIIRKMIIDHDDTNDITQDVFTKVWLNIKNFRAETQLYTWIYRIAVNESLNFLSKKKNRFFIPLINYEKVLHQKVDESSDLAPEDIQVKLQKALLQLPEKQRVVFNLRYFQELSYEDISEITKTSIGALKASYHLAVKKIEKFIFVPD